MPLYEYSCPTCGRFELIRKFSDDPVTHCPTCGAEVQKLLSSPAIQFKGTGWYITDYARKGGNGGGGEGKSKGKSESASESKSETKSDSSSSSSTTSSSTTSGSDTK